MHRFKTVAIVAALATFLFCGEIQAQRGKLLKRIRDDIFGTQPQTPTPAPRTPTLAQPKTSSQQSLQARQQQYSQYQQRLQQQRLQQQRAQQARQLQLQQQQRKVQQQSATNRNTRPQQTPRSRTPLPSAGRQTVAKPRASRDDALNAAATRKGFGLKLDTNRNDELFVAAIDPRGNAAQAGLRRGDVILEIGGVVATNTEEYDQISKAMSPGDQMEFRFERHGRTEKKLIAWGEAPKLEDIDVDELETESAPQSLTSSDSSSRLRDYDFVPPQESETGSQSVLNAPTSRGNTVGASYGSNKDTQQLSRTVEQQQQTIRQLQSELTRLRGSLQSGRR